jgi:hypothetical protein
MSGSKTLKDSRIVNWFVVFSFFFLFTSQLTFISVAIIIFLFVVYFDEIKASISEIDVAFLVFFALTIISSLFAKDKILASGSALLFVVYYIFFSVGRMISIEKESLCRFVLFFLILLALFGILFYVFPNIKFSVDIGEVKLVVIPPATDFEVGNSGIRSPSITPNPVIYSSIFLYFSTMLILWGLSLKQNSPFKAYLLIFSVILLIIIAMFTSNSRSLLLIFPVVLTLGLLMNGEKPKTLVVILGLLIVEILVGVYLSTPSVFTRIKTAILGSDYTSFSVRTDSYKKAIQLFIENPILGVGLMNFKHYVPYYFGPYVHSLYLSLLSETGILGTVAFFTIIVLIFRKFLQKFSNATWFKVGIISFIISFLLHGLVDNTMYVFSLGSLFWFFSGLLINENVA